MRVYIDQSGRIEDLSTPTALAFSNDQSEAILIPAKAKKEIFTYLRQKTTQSKMRNIRAFVACVFFLVRRCLKKDLEIIVDLEYEGWESEIKSLLLEKIRHKQTGFSADQIQFRSIGKNNNAHKLALSTLRKAKIHQRGKFPQKSINSKTIIQYL